MKLVNIFGRLSTICFKTYVSFTFSLEKTPSSIVVSGSTVIIVQISEPDMNNATKTPSKPPNIRLIGLSSVIFNTKSIKLITNFSAIDTIINESIKITT